MLEEPILKAIAHPTRLRLLVAFEARPESANTLSQATGEPLGTIAYHVRVLAAARLLELQFTERRRGVYERFYRTRRTGWAELVARLEQMTDPDSAPRRSAGGTSA
jgi:DNA-binding transcriptional ArsR family regulator